MPLNIKDEGWIPTLTSCGQFEYVSEIAKKYGGGGHRGASGFTLDNMIFRKEKSGE
jgi:nanoRNase/pAp phosphatase (c-di-AMP/oligoRNAs hydrolase)